MEGKEYQYRQIVPGIYLLYGFPEECSIYVVIGEEKAAVIDSGMGAGELRRTVEKIAPGRGIVVFNTHCHFDHSAGNFQFPEVYIHPGCIKDQDGTEALEATWGENRDRLPRYKTRRLPLKEGDVFDLGGTTLEVIETPGHTPGCVCLLDRKHRILFAGDQIVSSGHCVWMLDHLPWAAFSTVSMECYLRSLRKIESLGDAYDGFLGGHDDHILGKEYLQEIIRLAVSIIDGTAKPRHPEIPTLPGQEPVTCWRVDSDTVPAAILYQDEVIFDKN